MPAAMIEIIMTVNSTFSICSSLDIFGPKASNRSLKKYWKTGIVVPMQKAKNCPKKNINSSTVVAFFRIAE